MWPRLWLWYLEQRLKMHLGKYHAYQNRVFDRQAGTCLRSRLEIARGVLKEPGLTKGERWAEYQRFANRQAATVKRNAPTVAPPVVESRKSKAG